MMAATLDAEKIEKSHKLVSALELAHGGLLLLKSVTMKQGQKESKAASVYAHNNAAATSVILMPKF